jgi:hypothetical protein
MAFVGLYSRRGGGRRDEMVRVMLESWIFVFLYFCILEVCLGDGIDAIDELGLVTGFGMCEGVEEEEGKV